MIIKLAWKNLLDRPLSTLLSWILLSVSVGIISLLLLLQQQVEQQFSANLKKVDMVIGAKGSPLQLILSAVYHLDAPTGNISYDEAKKWMQHPFVETAIPLAYGDTYKGYAIVGTTTAYINQYSASLAGGKTFEQDFEVVIGSAVAKKLQLKVGSRFYSTHGNSEHGEQHDEAYTVTGVLHPSGSVLDNLLLCSVQSVWEIHEHGNEHNGKKQEPAATQPEKLNDGAKDGHHHDGEQPGKPGVPADHEASHEEDAELTAVLVKFRDPMGYMQLPRTINEETQMMAALPTIEINRLFTLFGVGISTLKNIGWGIMVLSALSVFVALFNSLKERRYELALMRTMGAGRSQLLLLLLAEGWLLCVAGALSGLLLSRAGLWLLSNRFEDSYHMALESWYLPGATEAWLIGLTLLLGTIAATVPAIKAWFLNISKTLSHA